MKKQSSISTIGNAILPPVVRRLVRPTCSSSDTEIGRQKTPFFPIILQKERTIFSFYGYNFTLSLC